MNTISPTDPFSAFMHPPKPLPATGGSRSSSNPSIRSSELWEAQARNRVPSTEKFSKLNSGMTSDTANSNSRNVAKGLRPTLLRFVNSSSLKSLSRSLVKVVGCQTDHLA